MYRIMKEENLSQHAYIYFFNTYICIVMRMYLFMVVLTFLEKQLRM